MSNHGTTKASDSASSYFFDDTVFSLFESDTHLVILQSPWTHSTCLPLPCLPNLSPSLSNRRRRRTCRRTSSTAAAVDNGSAASLLERSQPISWTWCVVLARNYYLHPTQLVFTILDGALWFILARLFVDCNLLDIMLLIGCQAHRAGTLGVNGLFALI
ncbi:hypothetical protein AcW1_002105 [Taiwanofungus camphoratus]|nr:hypothetical protein AcW1_002105 [Antrodia cinnamomea]KAI0946019.1 hypothetical protein AcV7_010109 [Antrodia cinnamomea]